FPKLVDMFTFTTVPAPPPPGRRTGQIDFKHGTATDTEIINLDLGTPDPSKMKFLELIKSMIFMSNEVAAGLVIDAVGYPYLNGALGEGGFFAPPSKRGLWVSGNYRTSKRDWIPDVDPMDLSPRGTAHYKSTTNFMGNAKQLARLLALLDREELFDGADAAACHEMRLTMRRHTIPELPAPDVSFIRDAIEATPPPVGPLVVDEAFSKIGIGVKASPTSTLKGAHDGAIIQRKKGAITLRYVLVLIGGYTPSDGGAHDRRVRPVTAATAQGPPVNVGSPGPDPEEPPHGHPRPDRVAGSAWAPAVPGVRVREHRWLHGRGERRRHLVRHRLRRRKPDPGARGSGLRHRGHNDRRRARRPLAGDRGRRARGRVRRP